MKNKGIIASLLVVLLLAFSGVSHAGWIGVFDIEHFDADGQLIHQESAENNLADEGEQWFLDTFLRGAAAPTEFYIRLSDSTNPCSIADTDNLAAASSGEPSTNGYQAQLVERNSTGWPTLALDSGDFQATSKEVTFAASGGSWGPVHCAFLATTSNNTGKHIAYAALSQARTLAAGESLKITYRVKLQ